MLADDWAYFESYFADAVDDRRGWRVFEEGAQDQELSLSQGTFAVNIRQMGPFGVALTENGEPLAAAKFNLFPQNSLFKVASVVDSECKEIDRYSNTSRLQLKDSAHDHNGFRLQLSSGSCILELKWNRELAIDLSFQREIEAAAPTPTVVSVRTSTMSPDTATLVRIVVDVVGFAKQDEPYSAHRRDKALLTAKKDANRNFALWKEGAELEAITIVEQGELTTDVIREVVRARVFPGKIIEQTYDDIN